MADKPIIFSAPMVRALLEGRKTQTRRIIKPQPTGISKADRIGGTSRSWRITPESNRCSVDFKSPDIGVGDRLYVREAVTWVSAWGWRYRADNDDLAEKREAGEVGKWRPSIHMPRVASRLTLTVTDVRVQRLQEISRGDAMGEGCPFANMADGPSPVEWFRDLWNNLHGPEAWDANPWVAAYSFTVQHGNIDQIGSAA